MKSINVKLQENSYPVIFSDNYRDLAVSFKKYLHEKKIFFISDTNVSNIYLKQITNILRKEKFIIEEYAFPAGEESKNIGTLVKLYNYALSSGIDRKFAVVALGGGVVGDTAGFFASTYMRGLKFVQIPTSLLAMVDSSIGGKTGVNIEGGKNIAGTFYQPKFVFVNTNFLKTLEPNHLKNGMAEVIKYAISFSGIFFDKLNTVFKKSVINEKNFKEIIYQCCKFKSLIVQKDEKEVSGIRELLNFGHTFAHALETITKYKKFLHGEAVAIGMIFAAKLGVRTGFCKSVIEDKVKELLINAGFDNEIKMKLSPALLLELMKKDKKSVSKTIRFVLPKEIGKAFSGKEIKDKIVLETIKDILNEKNTCN